MKNRTMILKDGTQFSIEPESFQEQGTDGEDIVVIVDGEYCARFLWRKLTPENLSEVTIERMGKEIVKLSSLELTSKSFQTEFIADGGLKVSFTVKEKRKNVRCERREECCRYEEQEKWCKNCVRNKNKEKIKLDYYMAEKERRNKSRSTAYDVCFVGFICGIVFLTAAFFLA